MNKRGVIAETDLEQSYEGLVDWLHERALEPWKSEALQRELLNHLHQYRFNIYRMHIGMPMLHPLYFIGT